MVRGAGTERAYSMAEVGRSRGQAPASAAAALRASAVAPAYTRARGYMRTPARTSWVASQVLPAQQKTRNSSPPQNGREQARRHLMGAHVARELHGACRKHGGNTARQRVGVARRKGGCKWTEQRLQPQHGGHGALWAKESPQYSNVVAQ